MNIDVLLDPLAWVAAALALSVLLSLGGRRCSRCVVLSALCLGWLIVLASPAFANRWLATVEDESRYPLRACAGAVGERPVVVLGGGLGAGYSNLGSAQRLSDASKNRALEGAGITPAGGLLFFSGGSPDRRADEAEAMAALTAGLRAPGVRVELESSSTNTHENARALGRRFDAMGLPREAVLVTSLAHMRRAAATFRAQGFSVCAHPVDPQVLHNVPMTALVPLVSAAHKTTLAVHEWVGWLYYSRAGYF